jgi:hypothetical protein
LADDTDQSIRSHIRRAVRISPVHSSSISLARVSGELVEIDLIRKQTGSRSAH